MANKTKNILIAEDEKPMAHALELKLEKAGFTPYIVYDGESALLALEKNDFAVILLDLIMPKIDGFGVLQIIREKKMNIPIIVLSNLGQSEDIEKAKKMGAKDYFSKSDTPINAIVDRVKQILDKKN